MDVLASSQTANSAKADQASLDNLLMSVAKVKLEKVEGQQLQLEINQQKITLPLDKADPKVLAQLKQLEGKQLDGQQLQKLLGNQLKIPVEITKVTAQTVTLEINKQSLELPLSQLKLQSGVVPQQLVGQNNLFATPEKLGADLFLKLQQLTSTTVKLNNQLTTQQLVQLLPQVNDKPAITAQLLQNATPVVELLGKLVNQDGKSQLQLGPVKVEIPSSLKQLQGQTLNNIRTSLLQIDNNLLLKLNMPNSGSPLLPVVDKKQLLSLLQFSLANNKQPKLDAAVSQSQANQIKLHQLTLPLPSAQVVQSGKAQVSLSGTAKAPQLITELSALARFTSIGQLKMNPLEVASLIEQLSKAGKLTTTGTTSADSRQPVLSSQDKSLLQQYLRQLVPQQKPASELMALLNATSKAGSSELRPVLAALKDMLSQQLPSGDKAPDSSKIQQQIQNIIAAPTPLIQPPSQPPSQPPQSFNQGVEGLMHLLLTAKVANQQNVSEPVLKQLTQFINLPALLKRPMTQVVRQLGQSNLSNQLLLQIAGIFAGQKMTSVGFAESVSQNNPQYFLSFPVNYQGQSKELEILIKPGYQDDEQNEQQEPKRNHWQLSLRFDIPKIGLIMANAQIASKDLKLEFYTETDAAVGKIKEFGDPLLARLKHAGLSVSQFTAQQGKIPETLQQKQHSLLYVRA